MFDIENKYNTGIYCGPIMVGVCTTPQAEDCFGQREVLSCKIFQSALKPDAKYKFVQFNLVNGITDSIFNDFGNFSILSNHINKPDLNVCRLVNIKIHKCPK